MFINSQTVSADSQGSTSKHRLLSSPLLLIGGNTTLRQDIQSFTSVNPDILIGTPGRLEEFLLGSSSLNFSTNAKKAKVKGKSASAHKIIRSVCSVKQLEMLVLDEADRLLELGFQASLNRILGILPKQRRTGCFSATMSEGLGELCRVGLRNPVRIVVKVERKQHESLRKNGNEEVIIKEEERNTPASLQNTYTVCEVQEKLLRLVQLVNSEVSSSSDKGEARRFIVYFATCACVDYFFKVGICIRLFIF